MSVEIKELVININIGSIAGGAKSASRSNAHDQAAPKKKKVLIEECAEAVLDAITKKNER